MHGQIARSGLRAVLVTLASRAGDRSMITISGVNCNGEHATAVRILRALPALAVTRTYGEHVIFTIDIHVC
jgi:hypothetical protein